MLSVISQCSTVVTLVLQIESAQSGPSSVTGPTCYLDDIAQACLLCADPGSRTPGDMDFQISGLVVTVVLLPPAHADVRIWCHFSKPVLYLKEQQMSLIHVHVAYEANKQ